MQQEKKYWVSLYQSKYNATCIFEDRDIKCIDKKDQLLKLQQIPDSETN